MSFEPGEKLLIVIAGPTASGKTAAAINLAVHFKTAIVSADSRQFYREMSLGTAKPSPAELASAPHYFIGSHSVTENFTAGQFESSCLALLDVLFSQHDVVIMAGGSGLFIKAVCEGFDELPEIKPGVRENLNLQYKQNGLAALQEALKKADPLYYGTVDINNPQRVIRALEIFESTGRTYSFYRKSVINKRPFNIIKFGLNLPREELYRRIDRRADGMIKEGLVEEVRSLLPFRSFNALNTVGYAELFDHFDGTLTLDAAIKLIKQNTRRFAKRQLTWFRKDQEMIWLDAGDPCLVNTMIASIADHRRQNS